MLTLFWSPDAPPPAGERQRVVRDVLTVNTAITPGAALAAESP